MSQIHYGNSTPFSMDAIGQSRSEEFGQRYQNIHKYISEFQVSVNKSAQASLELGPTEQSMLAKTANITVFKKKNLKNYCFSNIYEHNLTKPDIDTRDSSKSKVSCIRCRRSKKKCTRTFPECSNCSSSDELCVYLPRKHKKPNKSFTESLEEASEAPDMKQSIPSGIGITEASRSTQKSCLPNLLTPMHSTYYMKNKQKIHLESSTSRNMKDTSINSSKDLYKILN